MFKLRNKKQIKAIVFVLITLLFGIFTIFSLSVNSCYFKYPLFNFNGNICNYFDFKALDIIYRVAAKHGFGPKPSFSPEIIYLSITDETYDFFDKNYLDRKDIATLNNALSSMDTNAVIYDIVFARKSSELSDLQFSQSLENLGNVYLPTALIISDKPYKFRWKKDSAHERMRYEYLAALNEIDSGENQFSPKIGFWQWDSLKIKKPFYAVKSLTQQNDFALRAKGSGDISAKADNDGIYRHTTLVVRVDDKYFPTLSLAVFLDWIGMPLNDVQIEWGKQITIPASKVDQNSESKIKNDIIIPIDRQGRTFIPFVNTMGKDFKYMSVNKFLSHFQDENLRGNLLEQFEGNFVFVADIAIGTSDLGYTPLQNDAPLVITHASLLNAMLTNTFYSEWSFTKTFYLVSFFIIFMSFMSILRSSRFLYLIGIFIIFFIPILSWFEFISFRLFPIITVMTIMVLTLFIFITTLETSGAKERSFIKNTFARYVPEKVVNNLLDQPEIVTLGGEEKIVTVLFADIENFTAISEKLTPTELVNLLNEYFTEMSEIIMKNEGIIDKFQGDSIMAEFGMPLPTKDHADRSVEAALEMLERLSELREIWKTRSQDNKCCEIYCRIGINTNNMIVGNMGSKNVLDYTVIGDAVNLASRLEGANKHYGTALMISEFTYSHLTHTKFKTRIIDYVKVKGKTEPVLVYEVYGKSCDSSVNCKSINSRFKYSEEYYTIYNNGFKAYFNKRFKEAKFLFSYALKIKDGDKASILMLDRISKLERDIINGKLIDQTWDGSVSLLNK